MVNCGAPFRPNIIIFLEDHVNFCQCDDVKNANENFSLKKQMQIIPQNSNYRILFFFGPLVPLQTQIGTFEGLMRNLYTKWE